ncbi:MAG: hypothetical protein WA446_00890 [Steroidobacteraceae bacterium]
MARAGTGCVLVGAPAAFAQRHALIITPQGFPLAYEVLAGNTADNTTLKDFLARVEAHYGKARPIWLMDRGIPTEEVLGQMRTSDPPVQYLVGTPKGRLTALERALLDKPWKQVRPDVRVKLLAQDEELYVFAESHDRIAKERGMRRRRLEWLWARLKQLSTMSKLTREGLPMKLGAAQSKAPPHMATGQHRDRRQRRLLWLLAQSQEAARSAPPRRSLSTAHQPDRNRSGQTLGVLPAARRGRGHQDRCDPRPSALQAGRDPESGRRRLDRRRRRFRSPGRNYSRR